MLFNVYIFVQVFVSAVIFIPLIFKQYKNIDDAKKKPAHRIVRSLWLYKCILNRICIRLLGIYFPDLRVKTTNVEIGPVADQIYEIWNRTIFVIWIIRGKSKLFIYTKHSLLTINFPEQAYAFVQFSDLAKNWHICTPIIVNIYIPTPLDNTILIYIEFS